MTTTITTTTTTNDGGGIPLAIEVEQSSGAVANVLTNSVDGHQHALDPTAPYGRTSCARAAGAAIDHDHEFVRPAGGALLVTMNAGHTHTIDNATIGVRADAADPKPPKVSREFRIDEAHAIVSAHRGPAAADALRLECADKSDAYVTSRLDSLKAQFPRWQREIRADELVEAGKRADAAHRWHRQARADAADDEVSWPSGWTRELAVAKLVDAGVIGGVMVGVSDVWILGALTNLLQRTAPLPPPISDVRADAAAAGPQSSGVTKRTCYPWKPPSFGWPED